LARAFGRERGGPAIQNGWPSYLGELSISDRHPSVGDHAFPPLEAAPPRTHLTVSLPGLRLELAPGEEDRLGATDFPDLESELAVHRFAWLPLASSALEPGWVEALWRAWVSNHGVPNDSWAWHPYTAAERAINVLDYARRVGLPGPRCETLRLLGAHAHAIARRLEYNGDRNTSNHLSNNGRGLFLLGLALGNRDVADLGGKILEQESARIFCPSGMLREGSSHYHLLLARNYASAWLAAKSHRRPETDRLRDVTTSALAAASVLDLPAGLPLIGDISPDCPPAFLTCLLPSGDLSTGWGALLEDSQRHDLAAIKDAARPPAQRELAADGWLRYDGDGWSALWHCSPEGWSPMPGHGHQDIGGVEIHYHRERVVIDLGRGIYGNDAEAAADVSAQRHNGITVDGHEPYPPNRPYYSDAFRRRIGGDPPSMRRLDDGVELSFDGYGRVPNLGRVRRRWAFAPGRMMVFDRVEGRGQHQVCRRFHTRHKVREIDGGVVIEGRRQTYRLHGEGQFRLGAATAWSAYGEGQMATSIEIHLAANLPVETNLTLEVL